MSSATLRLPEPLSNQVPILESTASRKVLRCGRRFSKSRCAMIAGVDGHGPVEVVNGVRTPKFPGILQDGDVVWVAQDYPNLKTTMWREEFVPRFKHLPYVDMNENESRVSIAGLGSLFLRPFTAINGIRGIGKRLRGVILDEAAHYDLEAALRDVILPALLDNDGWLILMSTTNDGHDGNADKRVPSYFNLICEQIQRGERGPEWQEFHGTAYDNPKLRKDVIDALVREYTPGSASLRQEIFAELHAGGGRYYEVQKAKHLLSVADFPDVLPPWWEYWGAFDWGFAHWAVFGLFARDPDGRVYLIDSVWMRKQQDHGYASGVLNFCADYKLDARKLDIYAGHDCWSKPQARGASGVSTSEVFAAAGIMLTQADTDKENGGKAVRRALEVRSDRAGFVIVDRPPKPGEVDQLGCAANTRVYRQLADTVPDKLHINKPAKVDADPESGMGGDDGADMVRYGLATRVPVPVVPLPPVDHAKERERDHTPLVAAVDAAGSTFGQFGEGW